MVMEHALPCTLSHTQTKNTVNKHKHTEQQTENTWWYDRLNSPVASIASSAFRHSAIRLNPSILPPSLPPTPCLRELRKRPNSPLPSSPTRSRAAASRALAVSLSSASYASRNDTATSLIALKTNSHTKNTKGFNTAANQRPAECAARKSSVQTQYPATVHAPTHAAQNARALATVRNDGDRSHVCPIPSR